jgi:hypothetical protein
VPAAGTLIGGDQDAYGQYNNVDFYICNQYSQGRNYNLDGQWNYVQQYYRYCGNGALWVMENTGGAGVLVQAEPGRIGGNSPSMSSPAYRFSEFNVFIRKSIL